MNFDKNIAYIVKANLEHCVGLLEIDGINAKAKVKRQLKRLLDTYFDEDEEPKEENKNQ